MSNHKQPKIERRFFHSLLEERAATAGNGFDFGGTASSTGVEYTLYEDENNVWVEEISANAFDEVLSDDVRVLKNHTDNLILGRTKAGTAKVWVEGGLCYAWKNEPQITYASDLAHSIRRGDIDQSSFGFSTSYENSLWEDSPMPDGRRKRKRTILKIDVLYDVSPVTFPANPNTEVSQRDIFAAFEEYQQRNQRPPADEEDGLDIFLKRTALNEKLSQSI